ncbi:MAG: UvrD-helicase domain-containing protein [Nocardioides sp.]
MATPIRPRPETFDISGPLPTGTTLLEASAGTGKTWTIAALVARYVAEGVASLEQMLVVTFGRAASRELRERVRAQLVEAEAAFAGEVPARPNDLIRLLLDAGPDELADRKARIRHALATFDAATIATTHQFCSMVLDSLGVAGDSDASATLVDDLDELVTEVVDDLYLRAFAYASEPPLFSREKALEIARAAIRDPQARLEPASADGGTVAGRKVAFARAVRTEVDRRKRRLGILGYDDLLGQLADSLVEADSPARVRMRQRWRIVLVDEFQDTDPVQWQVLERAFSGVATMVLIGDPKQAIYAFRGGDVDTYLHAAASATTVQTLGVNWRSDAPLTDALQTLLADAMLGDRRIVVHPVVSRYRTSRLYFPPRSSQRDVPLRVRVVRRDRFGKRGTAAIRIARVRELVAADLADDIVRLLASDAEFDGRPLVPRDIAVIAHKHSDLADAKAALAARGVPAVIAGGGSVFATPAAVEWLTLLEALEQPQRVPRVRAAALTCFVGATVTELDVGGDELTDALADRLRRWAEVLRRRGVAATMEAAALDGLTARVLERIDGDRYLTDLRHIGEVLHEVATAERLGPVALVAWLREQVARARAAGGIERTRRLDSDATAVQLVTIHASKGLEYPIVYLPSLADRFVKREPPLPLFHDAGGTRCRNVAEGGPGWAEHVELAMGEEAGESLRLLYVALTRAQSQVVCWWAPSANAPASGLQRVLFGRAPDARGLVPLPPSVPLPTDDRVVSALAAWRDAGGPSPEVAAPGSGAEQRPGDPAPELRARESTRKVDPDWRRTSYSSLVSVSAAAAPGGSSGSASTGVVSEPEDTVRDDESDGRPTGSGQQSSGRAPESTPESSGPDGEPASPMAGLPVGATFGSLVHAVLEHADPAAPDRSGDPGSRLRAELRHYVDRDLLRWPVELDRQDLTDALVTVCDSPLGSLFATAEGGSRTLSDIPAADRLTELDFELPLAGGDLGRRDSAGPAEPPELSRIAGLLRRHLPEDDPVRSFADRLEDRQFGGQRLVGYLTGSIDLVARVDERFVVVDYKTNWLGPLPAPGTVSRASIDDQVPVLLASDYAPSRLAEAVAHSDYPLQMLLYSVVVHRFLRWRLAAYDPRRHLGGVAYLYLRGMCGPATPLIGGEPCGVFRWQPPAALVTELSDLLDGAADRSGNASGAAR